jgi:hypothetical protein
MNLQEKGSTAHQIGKNPQSNSGLPQEAEEEIDHLAMRYPTSHLFEGETVSLRFREQYETTVRVVKNVS